MQSQDQSQNQSALSNEISGINSGGVTILVVAENPDSNTFSRAGIGGGSVEQFAHSIFVWIKLFFYAIIVIATHIILGVFLWVPEIYKFFLADSTPYATHRASSLSESENFDRSTSVANNAGAISARWCTQTRNLIPQWHMMQVAAGATITASIALEQIQGVDSNPWTRTCAIMSAICAFASFLLSTAFIIGYRKLGGPKATARWIEASRQNSGICDKFWFFLALPLVWLFWSVILLFATILLHAWISNPVRSQGVRQELKRRYENDTNAINIISPLSITILSIIMVVQIFFVSKIILELDQVEIELEDIPVAPPV